MPRPVGKRRPRNSPRGDSSALCDICGVLWYRSALVRKADGNLYCPDDVRGMDSVTLSEGNARDAVRIIRGRRTRDSGGQDTSGFSSEEMPSGILSSGAAGADQSTAITGWWSPRDLRDQNGVSNMDNIINVSAKVQNQGNLAQVETGLRPSYDRDVTITMAAPQEYLKSSSYPVLSSGTDSVSIWCVAAADPSGASQFLWHLTDVGAFATYLIIASPGSALAHGVSLALGAGQAIVRWDNGASPSTITVSAPLSSSTLHLFELRVSPTELKLFIDNVEVGSTLLTAFAAYDLDYTTFGGATLGSEKGDPTTVNAMTGTMNELVVYPAAVTAAQATSMATYFGRTYTGLSLS